VVNAPKGAVTDDLRSSLTAHKPHLLARLGRDAQWDALSAQRWGPASTEPADVGPDPYAVAERRAIQTETLIDMTAD
jgi:hypothetical protein